ncbi:MAG: hypothetical protein WAX69_17820 [Victivallales bacterium]
MRISALLMAFAFFICASAQARIGESYDQCVKRYGEPVANRNNIKLFDQRTGLEIKQFKKESVSVNIVFGKDAKAIYVEYDYDMLKLETGEKSSEIIKQLLGTNGKDWKPDSSMNNRDWLLEIDDDEGVIASDKVEPGLARDRWICNGGPEKGGLIAVKSRISGSLLISNSEYMELVQKNRQNPLKARSENVKKALGNF